VHRLEAEAVDAAGGDPVLDVHHADAPWLEHAQKLGREEVHLPPEMRVVVGVPEVVVARAVFVHGAERDARDDEPHAVGAMRRVSSTQSLFTMTKRSPLTSRPRSRSSARGSRHGDPREPVLPDDRRHARDQLVVLAPLAFQVLADLALGLGVDQVHLQACFCPKRWIRWTAWMNSWKRYPMPAKIIVCDCCRFTPAPYMVGFVMSALLPPDRQSSSSFSRRSMSSAP
jgi:hypothetical protein